MTLEAWVKAGWLRRHETQPEEICHLWEVAAGDLREASSPEHDPALQFEYGYNAALKYCLILLYAGGLRPGRVTDVHHKILRSLPLTLGPAREVAADYLDACRERRDRLDGAEAERMTRADAAALFEFARDLGADVHAWIEEHHPTLRPERG